MNIKNGILNVPKHSNKHDLIHFVTHINADRLSRIEDPLQQCDCYSAGDDVKNLPCSRCAYCSRAHKKWSRFNEDVDDVVPLAVRNIKSVIKTSQESKMHQTSQESKMHQTSQESKMHQTSQESKIHQTSQESKMHQTSQESKMHQTSQESKMHQTSQESKSIRLVRNQKCAKLVRHLKYIRLVKY